MVPARPKLSARVYLAYDGGYLVRARLRPRRYPIRRHRAFRNAEFSR